MRLLLESAAVFVGLGAAATLLDEHGASAVLVGGACILQGCWFHRLYVVGHEAAHHKLFPGRRWLNDLIGQLFLLPLMVPLRIFRKIHRFHHGQNRRDAHTSSLDTFVVPRSAGAWRRTYCYLAWYLAVFAGGFFIHSLISVVLFLALPLSLVRRVSPAFEGWSGRDQLAFLAGVGVYLGVFALWGAKV